jgi:hypothetical protein
MADTISMIRIAAVLLPLIALTPARASATEPPGKNSAAQSICLMIESAAAANRIPIEFFARVIWQESRFRSDAVGPVTRSGERALGIAQFMPRTAAERGLLDPFDPVQALPKAAEFLRDLRAEFGNLGLAAAAYNAGPQRLRDYLAGRGGMPAETRAYVAAITGMTVDDWAAMRERDLEPKPAPGCNTLMALLNRSPNPFVQELERRVERTVASAWGVQLSAGFSRDKALSDYAKIAAQFEKLLQGRDPAILAGRNRSRGTRTFYQVRAGAETRAAANALCAGIRRAGGACMVLRNRA